MKHHQNLAKALKVIRLLQKLDINKFALQSILQTGATMLDTSFRTSGSPRLRLNSPNGNTVSQTAAPLPSFGWLCAFNIEQPLSGIFFSYKILEVIQ